MRRIKIAVLDTGLDMNDEEIKGFCKFDENLQIQKLNKCIDDFNGHGTFVCKTIIDLCENIEIYPIKIFNELGRTSSLNVILALQKILYSQIDVVNISASTFDYRYENELRDICDKLKSSNKIVVCSKNNSREANNSIPTIFDSVIGVKGHKQIYINNQYIYRKDDKIQMLANHKESFIKFKGKVTHFGKNSKACAVATGIIANILTDNPGICFNKLEEILIDHSLAENRLCEYNLSGIKSYKETLDSKVISNIKTGILKVINDNFSVDEINLDTVYKYGTMNSMTNIGKYNAYEFLERINDYFHININYKYIFIYNLDSMERLLSLILSYLDFNVRGVNKNGK